MECISLRTVEHNEKDYIVPCGKCLACLSNRRNDWAFRLEQEYKVSKSAYFVTLTYDRLNLKRVNYELSKRDLQLYFKRLRKVAKASRVRYYAVGEYGSKTQRPHYHILLFNVNEKEVRHAWQKGIVHVGKVSSASIRYTLKYIVQPFDGVDGKVKPFAVMSRGYGLGLNYLTDSMVAWHRNDDRTFTMVNGIKNRLPRYYRKFIWYKDADKERIAENSKLQNDLSKRKELDYFIDKYGKDARSKMLQFRNAVLSRIKLKVSFTQKF